MLESGKNKCVFTFGRFNPPHVMHEKLLAEITRQADANQCASMLFASTKQNTLKNPLTVERKCHWIHKSFEDFSGKIICDSAECIDILTVLGYLYRSGYKEVIGVFGTDRIKDMTRIAADYNGSTVLTKDRYFNFDKIDIVEFERYELSNKISGSRQRLYVAENDFANFELDCPVSLTHAERRELFDEIRESIFDNNEIKLI